MKKFFIFLLGLTMLFLTSCGEEAQDTEELSDIPDWDYSNAVSDNENTDESSTSWDNGDFDAQNPSESSTDANDPQPDESNISDEFPDNENSLPEGCGNETVEYNERCDSAAPITCSNLNPNMTGPTKCLTDCTAFDMSSCDKKVWGVLNVRFFTKFILDNAKTGDPSYLAQGTLPYSAFNGLYGDDKKIFPAVSEGEEKVSSDGSVSYAVTDNYTGTFGANKRQLFVKQIPSSGYPRHELEFAPGTLKTGAEYKINAVDIFDLVNNILKLVRYRLVDKQNGQECIMGIGYSGSVFITSVFPENADLYEGGSVEIVANDVDFYYPTEIPGRNYEEDPLSDEVLKYPICSK